MQLSTLCYIKKNHQTLMMHRIKKDKDVHQGKWNGLGGKFMPGESPEECVMREVQEESGLIIDQPRLRGIMTFPEFKDQEDWLVFLFTVDQFTGQLTGSEEGHLEWIADDKLLDLTLWEGDKYFLRWLLDDQFFSAKFIYKKGQLMEHAVTFYPPLGQGELS